MSQHQTQDPQRKTYSNSGLLRKNTKNPEKSDYTGSLAIKCPKCNTEFEMWLNGWKKQFQNGDQVLSLSVKPKDPRPATAPPAPQQRTAAPQPPPSDDAFDDEVPF